MESNQNPLNPSKIMQVGTGFMASKTLLTAVNMDLFTHLSNSEMTGEEIRELLNLHERSLYDFLDCLVSLGFLQRTGIKSSSVYKNTPETDLFLDKNKREYIGGILEMSNNRLYPFWNDLETALKTGNPQNETKDNGSSIFEEIYADPDKLKEFIFAMAGVQMGAFIQFAQKFDFSEFNTHCDVGGSGGHLSLQIVMNNEHMKCTSFDLPPVAPVATGIIQSMGLENRISIASGDFFKDEIPKADIITMGNILHDWGLEDKKMLVKKAFNALPKGGKLVIIENIIDDDRKENAFGLMVSLNMLIETEQGYDFSKADFEKIAVEIGFTSVSAMPLAGPTSAVIATK